MKRLLTTTLAVTSLLLLGPEGNARVPAPPPDTGPFVALLDGDQEVPPVETDGRGLAAFQEFAGGNAVLFALLTENLEDIVAAHIHLAPAGSNGPVTVGLFEDDPVTRDGLLSAGVITADDLVGPLEGMTIADLVAEMDAGNAYVNVHTLEHPAGEIRGQISRLTSNTPR